MAQIKLAEYTFDNSVGDCLPTLTPNTITMTTEDSVSGTTTRRIVYIDNSVMPTQISFSVREPLLTVDYLNIDSNITSMYKLFHNAKNLTYINVDNWNTSNVTNLYQCFYGTTALTQNIDFTKMNFAKVTNWYMLFAYSSFPRIDLSHVSPTPKSTDREFFVYCNAEYINISGWTFTNTMSGLFSNATQLKTVVLNNVTTTGVTNMGGMFRDCYNLKTIDVSSFDTSSVVNFANMFHNCSVATEIKGIENFNVSSVQNFSSMFYKCSSLTKLDLRNWVTSSATDMNSMFNSCSSLEVLRVDNFDTSNLGNTKMNNMFYGCSSLKTLNLNSFTKSPGMASILHLCNSCTSLEYFSMQNYDFSTLSAFGECFVNCKSLKMLDLTTTAIPSSLNFSGCFNHVTCPIYYNSNTCTNTEITGLSNAVDVKGRLLAIYTFDHTVSNLLAISGGYTVDTITDNITHRVLSSESMKVVSFYRQSNLKTVEYICVPNTTTSLAERFKGCTGLTSINTFGWDTSEVTDLSSMFFGCSSLTELNLSGFNTQNVTTMDFMFYNCSSLTSLDVSNFNTQNVKNMKSMFQGCSSLTSLDVSNFNTENVTNMSNILSNTPLLTNIGAIYCNSSTINKISNLVTTNTTIWYTDAKLEDLTVKDNITYKEYKTNILTVNEDVTLRSNGDVYDELNLLTGRLTQRIDENNEVLAQEVVKTVDLKCVNQDDESIDKCCIFTDGNIIISSDGLTPTLEYSLSTTNYFELNQLQTNVNYTLRFDGEATSGTLGGSTINTVNNTLVATSATDNILYLDGDVSNVMLLEGKYTGRDIPYFTGMRSVEAIEVETTPSPDQPLFGKGGRK